MNAIDLLESQHRDVEKLFKQLEDAKGAEAQALFNELADQLAVHATIEERHFYPATRSDKTEDLVMESLQEHLQVKRLIADLIDLDPDDETFDAKVTVLKEQVEHHVEEEEGELFPKARKLLGKQQLEEIGADMEDTAADLLAAGDPRLQVPQETEEAAPI